MYFINYLIWICLSIYLFIYLWFSYVLLTYTLPNCCDVSTYHGVIRSVSGMIRSYHPVSPSPHMLHCMQTGHDTMHVPGRH